MPADTRPEPASTRQALGLRSFRYLLARLQRKLRLSAIANSTIHPTSVIASDCQVVDTAFGRHSYCGHGCIFIKADVGAFCSIAENVSVGGSSHPMHFVSTSPVFLSHSNALKQKFAAHDHYSLPRTRIGNDVWIGYGARVRSGVTVGTGAVIGMGAVVTKDVAPYTVVAGNPAREISKRFPDAISAGLLQSAWWELSDDELREVAHLFNDPQAFLASITPRGGT